MCNMHSTQKYRVKRQLKTLKVAACGQLLERWRRAGVVPSTHVALPSSLLEEVGALQLIQ